MCGINGVYHPGDMPDKWRSITRKMTSELYHRGPDEDGFYSGNGVSLGMRRLKVIDMLTGSQPVTNENSDIHLVFNGEIYGFDAIREDLKKKGHVFRTVGDTEVLVHLYEEYGLQFFDHFDGMFVFALWDAKTGRLIIARDRFGIKPLFYTTPNSARGFAFASELRPLLHFPGLSGELDTTAVDKFFTLSYIPCPHSVYRQVKKLTPGCFLLAEKGALHEKRYWDLPCSVKPMNRQTVIEELDFAISESVKRMMRSDVPVGAFLSGGLDSGTVVYYMTRYTSKPVLTFSVRFAEEFFDEGDFARETADMLGTEHYEIWGKPFDIEILPEMIAHFGEPFADPSQIPTYLVSKLAREKVTVALSGDGGDEIFGGYETYCASMLTGFGRYLPEFIRQAFVWGAGKIPVSCKHAGLDYKLKKFLHGMRLPPVEHHAMWRTIFTPEQRKRLYTKSFSEQVMSDIDRPVFEELSYIFDESGIDRLTMYQYLDIKTYLVDNNLTKVDRMSMAHSLEVRIPMLDLKVADIASRLPVDMRVRGVKTKLAVRSLMRNRLPLSVLEMRKKGFAVPLSSWFKGPLKKYVYDVLNEDRVKKLNIIRPEVVREIVQEHMSGRSNLCRQIWNLICFLHWHEQNVKH